jgi:hypothetical protein
MSGYHLFHCRILATERLKMTIKNRLEMEPNLYTSMMSAKTINKTIRFLQTISLRYRKIFETDTDKGEGTTSKEKDNEIEDIDLMLEPLSKGEMQRIHNGQRRATDTELMIRISVPHLMYYIHSGLILSSTCLQNFSGCYMFISFVLLQKISFPLSLILSANGWVKGWGSVKVRKIVS